MADPGWMRILDYAEGMICNWGTHLLDVASLINNSERTGPISIEGRGEYPEAGSGLWDTLIDLEIQFKYANGEDEMTSGLEGLLPKGVLKWGFQVGCRKSLALGDFRSIARSGPWGGSRAPAGTNEGAY